MPQIAARTSGSDQVPVICDDTGAIYVISDSLTLGYNAVLSAWEAIQVTDGQLQTTVASFPVATSLSGCSITIPVSASTALTAMTIDYPKWDYQSLAYSGSDTVLLTSSTYKVGGSGGTTVLVITYDYDTTGNVTSITKT